MNLYSYFLVVLVVLCVICEIKSSQTLSPKNRGGKKKQEEPPPSPPKKKLIQSVTGPQKYSVFDKGFVSEDASASEIIANYQAFNSETDDYNFNGLVLGYVTPVSQLIL